VKGSCDVWRTETWDRSQGMSDMGYVLLEFWSPVCAGPLVSIRTPPYFSSNPQMPKPLEWDMNYEKI
jgi:hypothetical protein